MSNIRTYSELCKLETFEERYEYLRLHGKVGEDTFGFDRYMNQALYKSSEWKSVRNFVIARDGACDMGLEGYDIFSTAYVHHMNPIGPQDIEDASDYLFNPEYLITVSFETHNAIHYGVGEFKDRNKIIERFPNDTIPWKK